MKTALRSLLLLSAFSVQASPAPLTAVDDPKRGVVAATLDGEELLTLDYRNYAKPVIATFFGPNHVNLLRHWPMRDAAPNEATDHPHHKGLWFTHGAVNGVDFWAEGADKGKIVVKGQPELSKPGNLLTIKTSEVWQKPDDAPVCTSTTTIGCGRDGLEQRWLDYTITITASEGDVTFGDTKEGTMGLRSHPALNLKGKAATGHAENSEGGKDAAIWGKPARWVDYSGTIDGKPVGIACFDHPSNLRHPTTWHARDYGLIAANPFGLSDFEKKPKGTGDHTIRKGESLTFRYRWLFHTGDAAAAKVDEKWKQWAEKK